jgi:uncharacterized DUF497 family protein
MYSDDLEFVWDQRKSEANLALRGFDFLFATLTFLARRWSGRMIGETTANRVLWPLAWSMVSA